MPSHNPQNTNILELSQMFARTCSDHQNITHSSSTFKKSALIGVHVSSFNSQSFSLINITVTGEDETEGANFTKGETVSLDNISFENFVLKTQE
jgi:hypothetical protein